MIPIQGHARTEAVTMKEIYLQQILQWEISSWRRINSRRKTFSFIPQHPEAVKMKVLPSKAPLMLLNGIIWPGNPKLKHWEFIEGLLNEAAQSLIKYWMKYLNARQMIPSTFHLSLTIIVIHPKVQWQDIKNGIDIRYKW